MLQRISNIKFNFSFKLNICNYTTKKQCIHYLSCKDVIKCYEKGFISSCFSSSTKFSTSGFHKLYNVCRTAFLSHFLLSILVIMLYQTCNLDVLISAIICCAISKIPDNHGNSLKLMLLFVIRKEQNSQFFNPYLLTH